jgi:hypothetical protein
MTYCVGWKYENSVYLLADTAVTKSDEPATPRSSFGQMQDKVRGQYVEEALLKLVPISPGIAVAFAGDVQLAGEIIEFLQNKFPFAETFEKLFDFLKTELGPLPPNRPVQLLLATSAKNGHADLLYWDSIRGLNQNNFDFCQIGSLAPTSHADNTTRALNILAQGHIAADLFLPAISAIVQSYGVHDNIIDKNAGGIIFGLRSCGGIISWQEDTNYILYSPSSSSQLGYISAFVCDNVLVVHSALTNDTRMLSHSVSTLSFTDWWERWGAHIQSRRISDRCQYWVFISTAQRMITLVRRQDFKHQGKYFRLKYLDNGKYIKLRIEFLAQLMQLLDDGDGSRPFQFNFLAD